VKDYIFNHPVVFVMAGDGLLPQRDVLN